MDSHTIETLAITAVKESIELSKYLSQFIAENDRGPSLDGYINIYNGKSKYKRDIIGRINVQIKGKISKDITREKISYPVSIDDLNTYLMVGGVLFFFVLISPDGLRKKLYYLDLTPIRIRDLIRRMSGNQKTKSIELKSLPKNSDRIASIVQNCFKHCHLQASFSSSLLPTFDMLKHAENFEGICIPVNVRGFSDPESALVNSNNYLYAIIKGSPIPHPIDELPEKFFISEEIHVPVYVADIQFYKFYFRLLEKDNKETIKIGDSFIMHLDHVGNIIKCAFNTSDKLRAAATDLSFILAVIKEGQFTIGNTVYQVDFSNGEFKDFNVNDKTETASFMCRAVAALDILGFTDDISLSQMTDADIFNLNILITAFVDNKQVSGLRKSLPILTKMSIQGHIFLLFFLPSSESATTYYVKDFFRCDVPIRSKIEGSKSVQISQYHFITPEDYIEVVNVRYDRILDSCKSCHGGAEVYSSINMILLNLLKAYDSGVKNSSEALNSARQIAEWLLNCSECSIPREYLTLNYYQVIRRIRALNAMEAHEVYTISESSSASEDIIVGANLILGNKTAAKIHFERMSKAQQEEFSDTPIYTLFTQ